MKSFTAIFLTIVFISIPQLYAEQLKGEITEISEDKRSFNMNAKDAAGKTQELEIWLAAETQFKGLSSLTEVVKGDEVTAEAQFNTSTDRWEADSVELSKVVIRDPKPETPVAKEITEEKIERSEDPLTHTVPH